MSTSRLIQALEKLQKEQAERSVNLKNIKNHQEQKYSLNRLVSALENIGDMSTYSAAVNTIKLLENGLHGKDGYTPIKGVDYFDGKDGRNPIFHVGETPPDSPQEGDLWIQS